MLVPLRVKVRPRTGVGRLRVAREPVGMALEANSARPLRVLREAGPLGVSARSDLCFGLGRIIIMKRNDRSRTLVVFIVFK